MEAISITQIKSGNQISDLTCLSSRADKYPCYEITNGNTNFNYIDLVCDAQHFARFSVERTDGRGTFRLIVGDEQKVLSSFVNGFRDVVSTFPELDKEQFWQFVGFISIRHAYGAAVAIRVLTEDFLKVNYLAPSILKNLSGPDKEELNKRAKKNNNKILTQAIETIKVNNLFNVLSGTPTGNSRDRLRNKIIESLIEFNKSIAFKKRQFSKDQWEELRSAFKLSSKIIHGDQYDAIQLFNHVKDSVFKLFREYYDRGERWNE